MTLDEFLVVHDNVMVEEVNKERQELPSVAGLDLSPVEGPIPIWPYPFGSFKEWDF